jgi:hypothetical protein
MTVLAVVLGVALPLLAAGAVLLVVSGSLVSRGKPAPHATSLTLDSGRVVFTDNFSDPTSGWFVGKNSDGTSFSYAGGSYEIDGVAGKAESARAPYPTGLSAVAASASIVLVDQGDLNGVGLRCEHAGGNQTTHYVVFLFPDGSLDVDRYPGMQGDTIDYPTPILTSSVDNMAPSGQPDRVELACITVSQGGGSQTTRLLVRVGGGSVIATTDTFAYAGDSDWYAGVESDGGTVVDFSDFSLRNLEG